MPTINHVPAGDLPAPVQQGFYLCRCDAIIPDLAALGISHAYASPILIARAGSPHGYDVVAPSRINPELGGEAGLRELLVALHARDAGLIADIAADGAEAYIKPSVEGDWRDVFRSGSTHLDAPASVSSHLERRASAVYVLSSQEPSARRWFFGQAGSASQ